MAMSRALAAPAAMSWVTKLDLRSLAACSALSMADFFDHAILHEPLRQAAEARASSAER